MIYPVIYPTYRDLPIYDGWVTKGDQKPSDQSQNLDPGPIIKLDPLHSFLDVQPITASSSAIFAQPL